MAMIIVTNFDVAVNNAQVIKKNIYLFDTRECSCKYGINVKKFQYLECYFKAGSLGRFVQRKLAEENLWTGQLGPIKDALRAGR